MGRLVPATEGVSYGSYLHIPGLKDRGMLTHLGETDDERGRLARRLEEPTLWDAFRDLLEASGLPMPEDDPETRRRSLVQLAMGREKYAELFALSESLLTHDELFALWRLRHVLMVERQIGTKTGTGGSSGATYLRTTLERRFFPELWELRADL